MTETADVRMYYLIHQAMVTSGDDLHAALAGIAHEDRRRAKAIERWFDGFAGELLCHHRIEDDAAFPALAARVPSFERLEARVAADHHRLDDVLSRLRAALGSLVEGGDWASTQLRAATLAAELRDLLRAHLDFEDTEIVPLITQHLTVAEWEQVELRARKLTPMRQMLFTLPWAASTLDPRERDEIMSSAPKPLQLLWFMTRRGYARRTQAALGAQMRSAVR
jgi:hemerythrin-like domain-containing protein